MARNALNIPISRKEERWLMSKGGRDAEDVEIDSEGKFVFMRNKRRNERIYLPKTKKKTANEQKSKLIVS